MKAGQEPIFVQICNFLCRIDFLCKAAVDEGVDESNRVAGANVVLHGLRKKQNLGTILTCDVRHGSRCSIFGM